jgi:hypothetical protein
MMGIPADFLSITSSQQRDRCTSYQKLFDNIDKHGSKQVLAMLKPDFLFNTGQIQGVANIKISEGVSFMTISQVFFMPQNGHCLSKIASF